MRPSAKPVSPIISRSDRREHCSRPAAAYAPAVGVRLRHIAPTGATKVVAWPPCPRVARDAAAGRCSLLASAPGLGVTGRHGSCSLPHHLPGSCLLSHRLPGTGGVVAFHVHRTERQRTPSGFGPGATGPQPRLTLEEVPSCLCRRRESMSD